LDRYLDSAVAAGLTEVRIIHGKGTGALRRAIRRHLEENPLVATVRVAPRSQGGEGVTLAGFEASETATP